MYTILNNGTAMINCDDLQTAIRFVQSLEAGLDRLNSHSPYTIERVAPQAIWPPVAGPRNHPCPR